MIGHIYKYQIPITDHIIEIELPDNSKCCDIQSQNNSIYMWCMVDINAPLIKRRYKIFGTGHTIENVENLHFLKTVQLENIGLVFHVFEVMD